MFLRRLNTKIVKMGISVFLLELGIYYVLRLSTPTYTQCADYKTTYVLSDPGSAKPAVGVLRRV